jgi:hypothetical protein
MAQRATSNASTLWPHESLRSLEAGYADRQSLRKRYGGDSESDQGTAVCHSEPCRSGIIAMALGRPSPVIFHHPSTTSSVTTPSTPSCTCIVCNFTSLCAAMMTRTLRRCNTRLKPTEAPNRPHTCTIVRPSLSGAPETSRWRFSAASELERNLPSSSTWRGIADR